MDSFPGAFTSSSVLSFKWLPISWGKLHLDWNWFVCNWRKWVVKFLILYQYLCLWASRNFSYRQDDMLSNFLPTLLPPSHHKIWFHISTIFGFLFSQFLISYFYNFWFLIFTIFTLLSFLILCRFVQIARVVFSCILGVRDALKYIFRYYVCWINLDYL